MYESYFLRVQVFAFRLMGFDLWHDDGQNDRPLISFLLMGAMGTFLVPLFFSVKFHITDVIIMSDAMGAFLAITLTLVKYGVFLYYRKDFGQLICRIRGILEKEIADRPEAASIVESENRSDQSLSLTYMRVFCTAGLLAGIKPIFIMVANKLRKGQMHLELTHSGVYPWNDQILMYYVPTFIWNVSSSYVAVAMSLSMDTLLFAFTYNVCAVFKIAQHRIRNMQPLADKPRKELHELVQVVRLHQTGLLIATQLGGSFRPLIFMQFFITAVQLCFVGFQMTILFPSPECVYFIFFVGSLLIALFIYSHCGENMKQASADLAMAVYDSNWMDFAPATRRALIVVIMRSQRPCQLKGYFFEANMATFSTVIRSAISYVMMLHSFNSTG
ncbi:hypothetical protein ACLKA7_001633 [Drosophila subpalustris]